MLLTDVNLVCRSQLRQLHQPTLLFFLKEVLKLSLRVNTLFPLSNLLAGFDRLHIVCGLVAFFDLSVVFKVRHELLPRDELLVVDLVSRLCALVLLVKLVFFDFHEHLVQSKCFGFDGSYFDSVHIDKINDKLVSSQLHNQSLPFENLVVVLVEPVKDLLHGRDVRRQKQKLGFFAVVAKDLLQC